MASKGITLPIIYKSDDSGLKNAGKSLDGFGKKLAGIAALVGAAFSIRAISNFAKESVAIAEAAATAQARLEAVAKATGVFGAETAKVTGRLAEFAKAQELRIGVDDKVIKGVQAQLLSFKQLSTSADTVGGTFDRVTAAAFDMAAAGFGSAESNAIALGKAFEDPIKGLTALRRNGTVFTQEQQDLIKSLVQTGDVAAAQEIILGELESQYGGVAEATANASDKLAIAFENIKETAGAALLPVFADLVTGLMPVLEIVGEDLAKAFEDLSPVLSDIVAQIPGLLQAFTPLIPVLGSIAGVFFDLIAKLLPPFVALLNQLMPMIEELVPLFADAFLEALNSLMPALTEIAKALMPIVMSLLPVMADVIAALAPIVVKLVQAFLPLINLLLPLLIRLIEFLIPVAVKISEILAVVLVGAVRLLTNVFTGFMSFLGNFVDFFKGAFDGIRTFFFSLINGMIGMFESFVNSVINGVNAMVRALNRISFSIPSWVPGLGGKQFGFNLPVMQTVTFPRVALAEGGIVTGPINALIGEAGPEAVIPLDKMGGMGNTYNITVNAGMGTDGASVGAEIIRQIKRYERVSGPVFASA